MPNALDVILHRIAGYKANLTLNACNLVRYVLLLGNRSRDGMHHRGIAKKTATVKRCERRQRWEVQFGSNLMRSPRVVPVSKAHPAASSIALRARITMADIRQGFSL